MKKLYVSTITLAILFGVIFFDQIIVFLLSGFIPGIDLTIPATTMLSVMIASTILILALRRRHVVYYNCLELYDELFGKKKESDTPATDNKSKLPRRRYQEL